LFCRSMDMYNHNMQVCARTCSGALCLCVALYVGNK